MKGKNHEDFMERFRGRTNQLSLKGIRDLLGVAAPINPEGSSGRKEADVVAYDSTKPVKPIPLNPSNPSLIEQPLNNQSKILQPLQPVARNRRSRSRQFLPQIKQNKNYLPAIKSNDLDDATFRRYNSQPTRPLVIRTEQSNQSKNMNKYKTHEELNRVRYPTAQRPDFLDSKLFLPKKLRHSHNELDSEINVIEMRLNKKISERAILQMEKIREANHPFMRLVKLIN